MPHIHVYFRPSFEIEFIWCKCKISKQSWIVSLVQRQARQLLSTSVTVNEAISSERQKEAQIPRSGAPSGELAKDLDDQNLRSPSTI